MYFQVLAQVSLFFSLFYCSRHHDQVYPLLFIFGCSNVSSLYVKGISLEILFLLIVVFIYVVLMFPTETLAPLVFLVYFMDPGLARWGLYVGVQILFYFGLSIFLKDTRANLKKKKMLVFFLISLVLVSFCKYDLRAHPKELVSILSGASIIYICMTPRDRRGFLFCYGIHIFASLILAIIASPLGTPTIWGIPYGLFLFLIFHLWFILAFFLFNLEKKESLITFVFLGLFCLLRGIPELHWLNPWLWGIDLFLFLLAFFVIVIEEKEN